MSDRPVVVVIPTHREDVTRIVATVRSAMGVAGVDLVVLVDDSGERRLRWFDERQPTRVPIVVLNHDANRGPAAAMNTGVRFAPTDAIIARLDVGDEFIAGAKARQLRHVREHRICASFSPHFDAVERCVWIPPVAWPLRIYKDGAFCLCTCVFERSAWSDVGGFDESLRYADDWDFTMRVQHAVGWTPFDEVTCRAGAFPDGHTQRARRDPELAARAAADRARVHARGLELSHPRPQPIRVH